MVADGQFLGDRSDTGGRERTLRWRSTSASQWPASGGGYQPEQPSAWLNLSGSECCFLRMFMPPGSLLLWNVLLWSPSRMSVCEMVFTIMLYWRRVQCSVRSPLTLTGRAGAGRENIVSVAKPIS